MNAAVTTLLDQIQHPMRPQIDELRRIILSTRTGIIEEIKWNGPNYQLNGLDRLTIKVNPPKKVHLILHTGARSKASHKNHMEALQETLLTWKGEDRAVIEFMDAKDFALKKERLAAIISKWLDVTL